VVELGNTIREPPDLVTDRRHQILNFVNQGKGIFWRVALMAAISPGNEDI